MELKLSSYVHLKSINKVYRYCHDRVFLPYVGELYIFKQGSNYREWVISGLEHVMKLIINNNVLLLFINTVRIIVTPE